jgi:hypothetical protein
MPSGRAKRAKKAACYFADALTYVWTAIQLIGAFFFFKPMLIGALRDEFETECGEEWLPLQR